MLNPVLLSAWPRLFLDNRPDVAAAYSMRRLRRSWTGPLLRVRRSSDSAETDVYADARGWARADMAVAWASGSGFVAKWYDQSGNGRDLVQATASAQPAFGVLANGLPGMTFDGSNDRMAASFTLVQPHSRNVVYRVLATPGGEAHVIDGNTSNGGVLFFAHTSTPADRTVIYASFSVQGDATTMPVNQRGAVGATYNGASSLLELNGAAITSFSGDVGSNNPGGLSLGGNGGGSSFANVEVQELIQFNTAHTQAQLQADNAAMRAAWRF